MSDMYQKIKHLESEKVRLSKELRDTYKMHQQSRSYGLTGFIIKRDLARYLAICAELVELEHMRDELESLFAVRKLNIEV